MVLIFSTDNGAIYIFNGSPTGPSKSHSQVVDASTESWGADLHHFGWSISSTASGVDADADGYPELAVGAFGSDAAVLFKSRPVVDVKLDVELDAEIIKLNETNCDPVGGRGGADGVGVADEDKVPCIGVSFCFEYDGISVPEEISLNIEWRVSPEIVFGQRCLN